MNFFLTSLWLGFMTWLGYFIGDTFIPEHVALTTIAFFFLALLIRFCPQILGDVVDAVAD
jgi:membrane protein DedA with SNARE-associated domain